MKQQLTVEPSPLVLEHGCDGRLLVRQGGAQAVAAQVCRCFPWSEPTKFISLRDDKNNELALVSDCAQLGAASRKVLENAVAAAGFVLQITAVEAIEEEVEIRNWRVSTLQGPRTFQTRLDEWPRRTPSGGLVIRDVADDLFHIPDPQTLDEQSKALLWAFVD